MAEKLSEKEKALLILEKSQENFKKCEKQAQKITEELLNLKLAFEESKRMLKRVLNEEDNEGNIHIDCVYYNEEKDFCSNYMMGKYMGLAFECSRHQRCIGDILKGW